MSIHCTVYRYTTSSGRAGRDPWIIHAWWCTCEYDWGTVNNLCHSWQQAMDHANREIASVARGQVAS